MVWDHCELSLFLTGITVHHIHVDGGKRYLWRSIVTDQHERSITVVDSLSIVIDLPLPGRTSKRATVAFD
jgi:hypothetical protein